MVTRTRLVVAKYLAVMRMKSLLPYRRAASRTRAIKCLANMVGRGREGTGSIGVSVGRRGGGTKAAERIARGRPQAWVGYPWPKMRRSRSVTFLAPAFFRTPAR
ncbi:hypothetical protein GGD61_005890 [Bradyrhizobium sp. SBR1B]|nr:hypothetical protein [Bradyrhizobium sp. SBR1B]